MKVLHIIDNYGTGGIQELIFNLYKYSAFQHSGVGAAGSLSDEMMSRGFVRSDTLLPGFDVVCGHTVGGWKYDDTFRLARSMGMKTVEVMHSICHSPTDPSLCDGFIAMSELARFENLHMPNTTAIYAMANAVSPVAYNPAGVIGRVSRVVEEKRPDVFVRLAGRFPQYKFLLAGYGNMLEQLKSRATPNVEFTGMVRDFQGVLSRMKLFVFPTKDECCCMSVAMAQSAGLPCIVQDIPALRETTGGYATFASSEDEFASAISAFLEDQRPFMELAELARGWSGVFSPSYVCNKWEQYLEGVCG